MGSERVCIKCGGSWAGEVAFDTMCEHDFDDPAEPSVRTYERHGEVLYFAESPVRAIGGSYHGVTYPTREGAIALWKAAWCERRELERAEAEDGCPGCDAKPGDPHQDLCTFYVPAPPLGRRAPTAADWIACLRRAESGECVDFGGPAKREPIGNAPPSALQGFHESEAKFIEALKREAERFAREAPMSLQVEDGCSLLDDAGQLEALAQQLKERPPTIARGAFAVWSETACVSCTKRCWARCDVECAEALDIYRCTRCVGRYLLGKRASASLRGETAVQTAQYGGVRFNVEVGKWDDETREAIRRKLTKLGEDWLTPLRTRIPIGSRVLVDGNLLPGPDGGFVVATVHRYDAKQDAYEIRWDKDGIPCGLLVHARYVCLAPEEPRWF